MRTHSFFQTALSGLGVILFGFAASPAQANPINTISAVKLVRDGAQRVVRISGSVQPTFQRFTMQEPFRLVLDFVEAKTQDVPDYTSLGDGVVDSIAVESKGQSGTPMSRVLITFRDQIDYQISTQGNDVLVAMLGDPEPAATATVAEPALRVAQAGDEAADDGYDAAPSEVDDGVEVDDATPRAMTGVAFKFMTGSSRVIVRTNAKAQYAVRRMGDRQVVVEVQNARIPIYNNKRFLDTHFFASPVKMIQPQAMDGATPTVRIVIELKNEVDFSQQQRGSEIWVDFPNS